MWGRHGFLNAEAGFRWRSREPADQLRTEAAAGIDLTRRVSVIAQYFGITGLRNGSPLLPASNPNVQSDFDLYKGQVSLVTGIAARTRLQVGWCATLAGRNTGAGSMFLVALWRSF